MKEISKAFRCEFCGKLYELKHACEKHEKACSKNPDNFRPCQECIYSKKKTLDLAHQDRRQVDVLFCHKYEHGLIPPKAEHRGKRYDLDGYQNKPMPSKCEGQRLWDENEMSFH